jgi:hypothetical protein
LIPSKLQQAKVEAKAAREEAKAKADAEAQRAAEEQRTRRTQQLDTTQAAITTIEEKLRTIRQQSVCRDALASHLSGFYDEIDKLTKGKTLLEVTDLMVDQANEVIRDAKRIEEGDMYLNRVKEFVPAGNNPVYPDVLVTMRTLQQSLERCETQLHQEQERLGALLREARTAVDRWKDSQLTDGAARLLIYRAFIEGELEVPHHLDRRVHELYFNPQHKEFAPRTIWSLSNAFTSAFKELDPIPQYKATGKLAGFLQATTG